jgi:hypothetical protein
VSRPRSGSAESGLTAARLARTRAQTALLRHQLAEREGRMVPIEAALAIEQMRATEMRNGIQAVPNVWASRFLGLKTIPEAQHQLQQAMDDLLATLGRTGQVIRDRILAGRGEPAPERPRRSRRARR